MSPATAAALHAIRTGLDLLEVSVADSEPAPVSIVLVRTTAGRVHRAARIEGIPGLMTYEADNLDDAELIADLSQASDEMDLCERCFGDLDGAGG